MAPGPYFQGPPAKICAKKIFCGDHSHNEGYFRINSSLKHPILGHIPGYTLLLCEVFALKLHHNLLQASQHAQWAPLVGSL